MKKYIEKRVAYLTAEKEETLTEYTKGEHQDVLAERNMRISMELKFLDKLSKAIVSGSEPCKKEGCWNDATCEGYCGGHCNCPA